tara:strand:- start:36 stop:266 length:231 start_codon:yes stop_codon:yes gene_type:complete
MINTELLPIREILERIEKKIDGKMTHQYLNINQVSAMSGLSPSTIRRSIDRGELRYVRKGGKLIFSQNDVKNWMEK